MCMDETRFAISSASGNWFACLWGSSSRNFDALKSAIRWYPQRLIFCAFDLLHLNGQDLRDQPLLERRGKLKELIPSQHPFLLGEEFTGDAAAFFQACGDHQLEGIVSKLASSKIPQWTQQDV